MSYSGQLIQHVLACRLSEVPQGCKFEAPAAEVREWLAAEAADRASRVFAAMEMLLPPSREALLADDELLEARCSQGFATVYASEERWALGSQVRP